MWEKNGETGPFSSQAILAYNRNLPCHLGHSALTNEPPDREPMFSLRSKSRVAVSLTLLVAAWTVVGGLVLAAEGATDTEAAAAAMKGPAWAVAYIVILLLVGAGVFATVRGSKRRDRAKPEDFKAVVKH
jgi:hypothetical protein